MLNSQMIRINELQSITSKGFIVKLYSANKLPGSWPEIMARFEAKVRELLKDEDTQNLFQQLQFNATNRVVFQVPLCPTVPRLSAAMRICVDFCAEIEREKATKLCYFASKMNLEQAFLAYASHQVNKDAPVDRQN